MCGLCGVFNHADHWTSGPEAPEGASSRTPTASRHLDALAANDVLSIYGLKLDSWAGRYTLKSRTGKMVLVDNFGTLWAEAEKLSGQVCDPLDPALLDAMEVRKR